MMRVFLTGVAATATLLTAGCVDTVGSFQPRPVVAAAEISIAPAPDTSAATWKMPWQISPIAASQAHGEEIITAWVPQTGYVRGTRSALASVGSPLKQAPGLNRTIQACRDVVQSEAMKLGAREIEAASAGPDRRNDKGQFVGPVRMRITYASPTGYEVRESRMTCIVDARGKIVDAFV